MRQMINIDNLARLARERSDEPSWRSLWNAVVHLPEWYGVGTAERPDAPAIMRGGAEGKPVLFAFTDEARGRRFVNRAPRAAAGQRLVTVIRMPLPGAIRWAAGLGSQGVEHIVFNAGHSIEGFGFPITSLAQLVAALGRPPSTAPPRGPSGAGSGGAPAPDGT